VWWPGGWTARTGARGGVLLDTDGKAIASVGDDISIGGGVGSDGWIHACTVGRTPADLIGSPNP